MIKSYIYDPTATTSEEHKNFWFNAVQSTYDHIVVHPFEWPNLTFITEGDPAANMMFSMDTYSCFAGGNILYGSTYLEKSSSTTSQNFTAYKDLGLAVTASCRHLYATTVSGLGPAVWSWFDSYNHTYNQSWITGAAEYSVESRGYFMRRPMYYSFPETLESIFYAWRLTGDEIYADWAWEIFQSIVKESDYGLEDVDVPGTFEETLETYFFAESMKYLWLTFADPSDISLDEWVFNTEGHPFRIGGVSSCVKS